MDFASFVEDLDLMRQLLALIVGLPRILMIVQTAPFFGGGVVTGQLRIVVAIACYLPMHPVMMAALPADISGNFLITAEFGALIIKESFMGFLIGWLAGVVFWAVQSAGFFIDNQRGATMAEGQDPLAGEETTPMGSFLFQSCVYVFFASGAFVAFLSVVYSSYEIWPAMDLLPFNALHNLSLSLFFARQVDYVVTYMLLLSGPVVAACLLTDISLGLINRFASELNVYVLAMPIKSGIAAVLMLLYFSMLVSGLFQLFLKVSDDLQYLERILK